jgi:hypothetical protein
VLEFKGFKHIIFTKCKMRRYWNNATYQFKISFADFAGGNLWKDSAFYPSSSVRPRFLNCGSCCWKKYKLYKHLIHLSKIFLSSEITALQNETKFTFGWKVVARRARCWNLERKKTTAMLLQQKLLAYWRRTPTATVTLGVSGKEMCACIECSHCSMRNKA